MYYNQDEVTLEKLHEILVEASKRNYILTAGSAESEKGVEYQNDNGIVS